MSEVETSGGEHDSREVDITVKASKMGWVPLEKFKGDPERWTDAAEFVRRGEDVLPIVRKNNERLTQRLDVLENENATTKQLLKAATEALGEFQKYHEEDSKRQYERALEKLKSDKKEALRESDYDAVVEIDEAMKVLDEQKKSQAAKKPVQQSDHFLDKPDPTKDPEFIAWNQENSDWYGQDRERTAFATSTAAYLRAMEPNLKGKAFLDKVTEEVDRRFGLPDRPTRADRVEGSRGGASRSTGAKGYGDLPADAKATCDKFASRLVGEGKAYKTQAEWRKQYVKDYFGE